MKKAYLHYVKSVYFCWFGWGQHFATFVFPSLPPSAHTPRSQAQKDKNKWQVDIMTLAPTSPECPLYSRI